MYGGIIDASLDTVATTFSLGAGSLIITESSAGHNIGFVNATSHTLAFCFGRMDAAPESLISLNRNQGFVPPQGGVTLSGVNVSNKSAIFVRSADGTPVTSGVIYAWTWGL